MTHIQLSDEEAKRSLFETNLSYRLKHALWLRNIRTVGQLAYTDDSQLTLMSNIGNQLLQEIRAFKQLLLLETVDNSHIYKDDPPIPMSKMDVDDIQVNNFDDNVINSEIVQKLVNSGCPLDKISPLRVATTSDQIEYIERTKTDSILRLLLTPNNVFQENGVFFRENLTLYVHWLGRRYDWSSELNSAIPNNEIFESINWSAVNSEVKITGENNAQDNSTEISLDSIDHKLSKRTYNCLIRARIATVEKLMSITDTELLKINGLGSLALTEIHELRENLQLVTNNDIDLTDISQALNPKIQISDLDPKIIARIPIEIVNHGLSKRVINCIRRVGIESLMDLLEISDETLLDISGMGETSLVEIHSFTEKLKNHFDQITSNGFHSPLCDETSIFSLDLSLMTLSKLYTNSVREVNELVSLSDNRVDEIFGSGAKAIVEIAMLRKELIEREIVPIINRKNLTTPILKQNSEVTPVISEGVTQFLIQLGCPLRLISAMRMSIDGKERLVLQKNHFKSALDVFHGDEQLFDAFPNFKDRILYYTQWLGKQSDWQEEVAAKLPNPNALYEIRKCGREKLSQILVNGLANRDRDILEMNLGWHDGDVKTLQQIADKLGISRARVHQILVKAKRKTIINVLGSDIFLSFIALCKRIVDERKLISLKELIIEVNDNFEFNDDENDLSGLLEFLLEELNEESRSIGRLLSNRVIVTLNLSETVVVNLVNEISKLLIERKCPIRFADIHDAIAPTLNGYLDKIDTENFVRTCLQSYPDFKSFEEDNWGLKRWDKKVFDDIVMVFRSLKRPAHFTEITILVNNRLSPNSVSANSVHATLGRETDLFIRTDSGIFALREWYPDAPVQPPKYVDLMEQVLEEAGYPLTIDEIFERVDAIRHAKKTSIVMYLGINERFVQTGSKYGLAKWGTQNPVSNDPVALVKTVSDSTDWMQRLKRKAFAQINTLDQRKDKS